MTAARRRRRVLLGLAAVLTWAAVAVPSFLLLFFNDQAPVVVASHDAVVRPTWSSYHRLELGPLLPDARIRHGGHIGVDVTLGKTAVASPEQLVQRYVTIAGRPEPAQRRVREVLENLAVEAGLRAAALGMVPIVTWLVIGPRRRRELAITTPYAGLLVLLVVGAGALALVQPWRPAEEPVEKLTWIPLQQALPEVPLPKELRGVQVSSGLLTQTTRHFVTSGLASYRRSQDFYRTLEDGAGALAPRLHTPQDGDTVALVVSDRHDNIPMDGVARAVADQAGATVLIDAGDDTSSGEPWEAFSLDSLDEAFDDYDEKVFVAGNHDHGTFYARYLRELGWTHLDGEAEEPFAGVRMLGVDDPRSSGLGAWRDEKGLSFAELRTRLADEACDLDENGERVATLLVHDGNLAREALQRGCVDLVVAGHVHRQIGPKRVVGTNEKAGYNYANGTTGGAAYAIAIGGKPRRDAEFTFVTYRDGRPLGIQPVMVTTGGKYVVEPWTELSLDPEDD